MLRSNEKWFGIMVVLVVCLATTANAALTGSQISVNGATDVTEITIDISETVVLDIHVTAEQEGLVYLMIIDEDDPYGEWYDDLSPNVAGKWETSYAGYPAVFAGAGDFSGSGVVRQDGGTTYGFGYEGTVAGAVENPDLPGGKAFEFLYHCEAEGDVVINLLEEADLDTPVDTLTIHQVPEPMTVMLLGLGGLALRRKHRTK